MNLQQINSLNLHMKPINKIIHNNKTNKIIIHCYCCSNIVDLNSSGCHRSHNIPKKN